MVINKRNVMVDVGVRTLNGTALAGEDYVTMDKAIHFLADEREKEIKVEIIDDDQWEPDEDFYV